MSSRIFMDAADADMIEWNWNRKRGISEKSKEVFAKNADYAIRKYRNDVGGQVSKSTHFFIKKDRNHNYLIEERERSS